MIKGKRNGKAALLLSAALAATGCSTGWQPIREDWTPIQTTPNSKISNLRKTENVRELNIPSLSTINGNDYANITQKVSQETFDEIKYGNLVNYEKILREEDTTRFPLFTGSGIIGGAAFGAIYAEAEETLEDQEKLIYMGLGAVGGALIGIGLDQLIGIKTTKSRTRSTGETKTLIENEQIYKDMIQSSVKEGPAKGIKVLVDGVNYIADLNGRVNLSDIVESRYPNYFCRESNFSGKGMESRIRSIPLVTGLKPKTLDMIIKKLAEEADPVKIIVKLKTNESPNFGETLINWDGTATFQGYKLSDEDIYKVIEGFIDENINSKIVSVRFDLKDLVSRTSIDSATFSYEANVPSREDLINQYFNERLKGFADSNITDYLSGSGKFNVGSSTTLRVYSPSQMRVEFTNPDYRFVEGDVFINRDGMKKTVYMADKGSKVRIDSTNDGNGKIE
jgi:hypothetical protein